MYLVEYIGGEPVYKTTNTLITGKLSFSTFEMPIKNIFYLDHQGHMPAPYQLYWPAFIPSMWVADHGAVNM